MAVYLDNAATSWPKPEAVLKAMDRFLREQGGNPGHGSHSLARAAAEVVKETRVLVSRVINAPCVDRVIFTAGCTASLNMGLKGLLRPGDHVIISRLEHNSVVRPLRKLEGTGVKVTRLLPSPDTGVVSPAELREAMRPETKLVVMTHASNVNGVVQPIAEYGAVARDRGVFFMVDAAQTAGKFPLDVKSCNVDILAASGHKGLLGPPGVGMLYVGPGVELDTLLEGGTGSFSELEEQPMTMPDRCESGTMNGPGISGLGAGLKFILEQGMGKILAHEQKLTSRAIEGLRRIPGVFVYTAGSVVQQAPAFSFNVHGYAPGEVGAILDQSFGINVRTGLHCAPEAHRTLGTFPNGAVRVSPGYFNTPDQIEQLVDAVERLAKAAP